MDPKNMTLDEIIKRDKELHRGQRGRGGPQRGRGGRFANDRPRGRGGIFKMKNEYQQMRGRGGRWDDYQRDNRERDYRVR